ncbi:hypothetical protein E8E15_002401 [Penicillium rubens]|uniref:Pc21g01830 protein n=2 Tax=Penicillium chrysogenum species complex TaxID=254878 RepID=B6HJ79_PENRW|nr:uncharacterized protein N7525_006700 [Penicillium rubens]XP_056570565.1 uncharacterized protein N7489_000508 [Penicillium chrysogenum]CAP95080.1 Pc21g01830 [Penicillium rubens Wisconsin 54-1255]KAF3018617.1 hypothetical protein E8E15_002401 [Penicillium rubens]KAJ5049861.1 hypothetical protein NUH16_008384 [Penicillium rubens]KAJ5250098.1 hypothetical protein N7489_000508 [Penicillium chrysogenum]KAJ5269004.1 hypothetical protein N7505_004762 [Penicillium chrysogenum]
MASDEYPPYIPMPSLGHELGLMFGFLSLCIVVMGAYVALWRVSQTRLDAQDLARRKAFRNKNPAIGTTTSITAGRSRSPIKDTTVTPTPKTAAQEKMLDRVVLPENRAELPVHGMEMYTTKGNASISQIRSPLGQSMLSPVSPVSPLGSGGLAGRAVGSISPVGGGIALESIVGMALEGGRSLGQGPFRDGFRSASPARRFGGGSGPAVEIGPAPSRE